MIQDTDSHIIITLCLNTTFFQNFNGDLRRNLDFDRNTWPLECYTKKLSHVSDFLGRTRNFGNDNDLLVKISGM